MFYLADKMGQGLPGEEATPEQAESSDRDNASEYAQSPVAVYLKEVARIPLLSRDREIELARRIQLGQHKIRKALLKCGKALSVIENTDPNSAERFKEIVGSGNETRSNRELIKSVYQRLDEFRGGPGNGKHALNQLREELRGTEADVEAAKTEMIRSNLRLVVRMARMYVNRGLSLLDLIQEGNLGLMMAVTKYDYRKGFKFSTYASWWIRQGMTRALADKSRTVRVPVHLLDTKRRIDKASKHLMMELGREPVPEEVAEAAGVSPADVRKVMDLMQEPVSMETPFGKDGGRLEDFMESEASESVRVDLHRNMDLVKKTRDLLSALPPREAQILRLRYGIDEPWSHTLQEIGKRVGISRERVRQIEDRALKRLKTPPFIAQVEACESIR